MQESEQHTFFKNIKGVIWDLDNTLYRFDEGFEKACHIAAAKAAIKGGLDKDFEQAFEMSLKSYELYGHSCQLFTVEYQIDSKILHHDYHEFINEKIIEKSLEVVSLFEQTSLSHALVTHASMGWASRMLEHLGLKKFFDDERIFAAETVDFNKKSQSEIPFNIAVEALGIERSSIIVVEDLAENLKIPSDMGIKTALVHYGQRPHPMPSFIDFDCANASEFLKNVINAR